MKENDQVTNLRQAESSVNVVGVLSEKNLKVETKDGKTFIMGQLSIQTDATNTVTFNAYANQLTKDGKKNSNYTGLETIMNQYKSLAEVGKADATWVRVSKGELNPNSYVDKNGNIKESMRFKSNFFNRLKDSELDGLVCVANGKVEIFIASITHELAKTGETKGEETGRAVVRGWMPTYDNGVEPVELIAPKDIAEQVIDAYVPGQTVSFDFEIISSVVIETKTTNMAIGKPRIEEIKTYTNELIVTGATEAYTVNAFDAEAIEKAKVEREGKLAEKAAQETSSANTGATQRSSNVSGVTKATTGSRKPNFM